MPDDYTTPIEFSKRNTAPTIAEPIAVIGMGCRFPGGANSPEAFWQLLIGEQNAASVIPEDRWSLDGFYDPDPETAGKCYTSVGHFLKDPRPSEFDAEFFRITPREAKVMDPQQRIILEVVWEALENANIAPTSLYGSDTGVFIGCYDNHHLVDHDLRSNREIEFYLATSIVQSITVGRISYFLNLHGPNYAVNTACSSSLIALHQACQSLRTGECSLALTGGVNMIISQSFYISLAKARMLSPDGLCKTFDNSADGYGRGEGCGVIVLKRLKDALEDGDKILALIRGTAINHDGRTAGITAPNSTAQQMVIHTAHKYSGIVPSDIHYVEAHGTGTAIGDPIELNALAETFRTRDKSNPLRVGSVKTNIGHLEAAAGIAGVIKTILALNREYLPRHLNVSELNNQIPWDKVPIQVLTKGESWPVGTSHRFAGVSSFGFGGSNAHVILEGAEFVNAKRMPSSIDRPKHILTLSALNEKSLQALSQRYAEYMAEHKDTKLADIAYTANTGRAHLRTRLAVVGESTEEVASALKDYTDGKMSRTVIRNDTTSYDSPQVGFLFTGQGAQYPDMGKGLYEHLPSFRQMLEMCDGILAPHIGKSLIDILYRTEGQQENHPINQTALTQPTLFALEATLAKMLIRWGIRPAVVMGHSLGESIASYISGVFSLEDGLSMVSRRGALMQALPHNGIMVAVETDAHTVQSLILALSYENSVGIAAYNGPHSIVISGEQQPVEHLAQLLKEQGVRIVPLRVSHAFHSELMMPMVPRFKAFIDHLKLTPPQIPLVSTVTGQLVTDAITSSEHWGRGVRGAVRFEQAIKKMIDMGVKTFVEIGPHPVLSGMGRKCVPDNVEVQWLPLLRKSRDDWSTLLQTIGQLHSQGVFVNWQAFDADFKQIRQKVHLPTYAFQRQVHWVESMQPRYQDSSPRYTLETEHPLLGHQFQLPGQNTIHYEAKLFPYYPSWIKGHQFFDHVVLPAAAYLEMALALAFRHLKTEKIELRNIGLHNLLHINDTGVIVHYVLHKESDTQFKFEVFSHPIEIQNKSALHWERHVSGLISEMHEDPDFANTPVNTTAIYETLPYRLDSDLHYKIFQMQGLTCSKDFQILQQVKFRERKGMAKILAPDIPHQEAYHVHPTFLDGGFQLAGLVLPVPPVNHNNIPVHIDKVRFYRQRVNSAWCLCQSQDQVGKTGVRDTVDLSYYDEDGFPIVVMEGVKLQIMREEVIRKSSNPKWRDWLYKISWRKHTLLSKDHIHPQNGNWLIFNDTQGVGNQLAKNLQASGQTYILVNKGDAFSKVNDHTYEINPHNADNVNHLLDALTTEDNNTLVIQGIVHLWSLDINLPTADADILSNMIDCGVGSVLYIIQSLLNGEKSPVVKIRLVTRGTIPVNDDTSASGLFHAPLWGLGRVINLEHPEFQCRMIDLDPEAPQDEIEALMVDIQQNDDQAEIVHRQGTRYIPKLVDIDEPDTTASNQFNLIFPRTATYQLQKGESGSLDSLYLASMSRRTPGPNEIEIAVRATGLNFIDVLDVMDLLPFERPALGGECAGVITTIGESVSRFKVGERVVGLTPGCFSRYVITSEQLTVAIPDNLSFEQASGIPIVYLTAYFALYKQAKLSQQDRILIHAAAGGVGYAAVQLAKRAGAEIYATASPPKWGFLRDQGITHIMNSRTLEFESEIFRTTDGQGVDVVLNSLSGDFIPASLSAMAPQGRFVEIGKRAIWSQAQANEYRSDINYAVYDLITHMISSPSEVSDTLRQIFEWMKLGELHPIPITPYPIQATKEAFRLMQQAKHTGKIIITQSLIDTQPIIERRQKKLTGTHLVTGGWGALGIEVASWLAFRGAQQIVLMGRSAPDEKASEVIRMIRDSGTLVTLAKSDVSDYDTLSLTLKRIEESQLPLRGVFHIAGVLQDGVIRTLSNEQLEHVMKVKIQGAWNLHQLTLNSQLDLFVMFSSVASVFGSPGQANYAAANAFLDSLAHYRKKLGKPGLSINWGAWSGGGMATRTGIEQTLANQTIYPIHPPDGIRILQNLTLEEYAQVIVFPVDWQQAIQSKGAFTHIFSEFIDSKRLKKDSHQTLQQILNTPRELRRVKFTSYVREIVAQVLRLPSSSRIDDRDSFVDLGMDSLVAVELRNIIQESLDCALPATLLIDYPTLDALTYFLADKLNIFPVADQPVTETPEIPETSLDFPLDSLSEDELMRQLDEKIDQLEDYTVD